MLVSEREITLPAVSDSETPLRHLKEAFDSSHAVESALIKFAVVRSDAKHWHCEVSTVADQREETVNRLKSIFNFRRRNVASSDAFNAVLVVPTGIGAEIGGHAGDATAAARLVAQSCDRLILHPNVVNASDVNEAPHNALYIEGSVLTRLLMGTVGLQQVSSNRVLVVIDDHPDGRISDAAINTVSAARATYGLDCTEVIKLAPPVQLWGAKYSQSGRAVGEVRGLDRFFEVLEGRDGDFNAIALASVIRVPQNLHLEYFQSQGDMVNPWGGVESMLTHTISTLLNVPSAHSPMFESREIENLETGIVEPRMSAEAVSVSFLQCVLKGLHTSPKIITDHKLFGRWGVLSAEDVSCLVIPDGCLGLPTLAALEQGIPVIAVRENRNLMQNDLTRLSWKNNQFHIAENYLEAVGIINAMKAGVTIESVRRPLRETRVSPEPMTGAEEPRVAKVTS